DSDSCSPKKAPNKWTGCSPRRLAASMSTPKTQNGLNMTLLLGIGRRLGRFPYQAIPSIAYFLSFRLISQVYISSLRTFFGSFQSIREILVPWQPAQSSPARTAGREGRPASPSYSGGLSCLG